MPRVGGRSRRTGCDPGNPSVPYWAVQTGRTELTRRGVLNPNPYDGRDARCTDGSGAGEGLSLGLTCRCPVRTGSSNHRVGPT